MKLSTIAAAGLLAMASGAISLPAAAAEMKTAPRDSAQAAKAPPSHFTYEGQRVIVVPRGSRQAMGRVRTPKRDLTVVALNLPNVVRLDEPFPVSFYIRNNGASTIARLSYRMAPVALVPPLVAEVIGDVVEGVVHNLAPGRDRRIEHTVVLRSDTPDVTMGWTTLVVVVDPGKVIDEEDEDNNSIAVLIPLAPGGG
jgi:hypothetical protein